MSEMTLRVECYSGHRADERPVRFWIDDHSYFVEEIMDQWHGPDATFFKVRADDGNLYILRHNASPVEDAWSLEAFRHGAR
jgi:hypothetical protein